MTGSLGEEMHRLVAELFPLCRSITGDGVRQTFRILAEHLPLEIHQVPTGTQVLDWTVPPEWNIRDAWVKDPAGRKVVDFSHSNLHVVSYSRPVRATMSLGELRPHLHTLPDQPGLIPYRTTYYADDWGFCVRHDDLARWPEGEYEVCIDSSLTAGHLTWAEYVVPGRTGDEVIVSSHVCHPSLANDNLAGIAVAAFLARRLHGAGHRCSYRFLFAPGTIGSITWLASNPHRIESIRHGLILASLGDPGPFTYKRSRRGTANIDRVASHVLAHSGHVHRVVDFSPYGYDERQYCSPGFNLPVGCLTRSPHGEFPEYHTSADNLSFVQPSCLAESLEVCWNVLQSLDAADVRFVNRKPYGEPQLGRRGLYGSLGGRSDTEQRQLAMLWVLNFSDGSCSLLDIAERSGLAVPLLADAAGALVEAELLTPD